MKVLQITNNYPTAKFPISGIFVKEQIDSISKYKIQNTIFLINGREKGKIEYLNSIFRLRNLLRHNHYNIIHCHHILSALSLLLSGYFDKNVIVSYQSDPKNEKASFLFYVLRLLYRNQIFKNNSSFIKKGNDYYLPNGVNLNFFKPIDKPKACKALNLDEKRIYVLFVSSNFIRKEKRLDRFRKVLELVKEDPKFNNVEGLYLINESRDLIPYYFNIATAHLLLSDFEGSPNSVKEAMACNIPVLSTDVGNVRELLEDVENCHVMEKYSESIAAEKLKEMIIAGKSNGRAKLIERHLTQDDIAKKLVNIYYNISNKYN